MAMEELIITLGMLVLYSTLMSVILVSLSIASSWMFKKLKKCSRALPSMAKRERGGRDSQLQPIGFHSIRE